MPRCGNENTERNSLVVASASPKSRPTQKAPPPPQNVVKMREAQLDLIFKMIDKNGDGQLSRAEMVIAIRSQPTVRDALGLSDVRASASGESRKDFEYVFQAMDTDDDRNLKVRKDEFIRFFQAQWQKEADDAYARDLAREASTCFQDRDRLRIENKGNGHVCECAIC